MDRALIIEEALLGLSLFSGVLLLWLALTVLLNSRRRTVGVWAVGLALLVGAGFFMTHASVPLLGMRLIPGTFARWWPPGWTPGVGLPLAWCAAMIWHAGYWTGDREGRVASRRRWVNAWLGANLALGGAVLALMYWPDPALERGPDAAMAPRGPGGVPLLIVTYALFLLSSMGLALRAILRPAPARSDWEGLARDRARPWLAATTVVLLLAGFVLSWVLVIIADWRQRHTIGVLEPDSPVMPGALLVAGLVAIAVVLQGQAIVAYEIFTGHTLPRRGLARQWRSTLVLGGVYSLLVVWIVYHVASLTVALAVVTLLVAASLALLGWRSFAERDRYMSHLRPFVASQGILRALRAPEAESGAEASATAMLAALSQDVLEARCAYLIPLGSLVPLVGEPLGHPESSWPSPSEIRAAEEGCLAAEAEWVRASVDGRSGWAVPLREGARLRAVLLLGPKALGGLYTQEEMDVARIAADRILDVLAGRTLAERLMTLQRERVGESQLLDHRARRALHDDVLPQLHTAMLELSAQLPPEGPGQDALRELTEVHSRISSLLRNMPVLIPEVVRLGPLGALRRELEGTLAESFDGVEWRVALGAEHRVAELPPFPAEVLFCAAREAARNAARHGRGGDPQRRLDLSVSAEVADELIVGIEDSGVGLEGRGPARGAGQGLALHSAMMAIIGGELALERIDRGDTDWTRVELRVPLAEPSQGDRSPPRNP
jgi:signal transduction histidine kinase